MEQSSERSDFVGRVVRQLLVPPVTYQEVVKKHGTPKTITKRLGPRVCLRKFANKQFVGYGMAVLLLSYTWGWAPEILILLIVCCICAVVFVRASLETWRASGGRVTIDAEDSYAERL